MHVGGGDGLASMLDSMNIGGTETRAQGADTLDDDLRFAIELSLAEARSRGEDV